MKTTHPSVARNPLIVHTFYLAGLIEEYGSGIGRIMDSLKEANLPEPEFKEEFAGFSLYLRKDYYTEKRLKEMGLNDRQIKAVMYVKENRSINLSSFKTVDQKMSEKTLYRDLQDLVAKGILKEVGKKKGRKYELG